jgi:hypothetical protein
MKWRNPFRSDQTPAPITPHGTPTQNIPAATQPAATQPAATQPDEQINPRKNRPLRADGRAHDEPLYELPVGDYPETKPGADVGVRLHLGYDPEVDFATLVQQLAAEPGAAELRALSIGSWTGESLDDGTPAVDVLVASAASFPNLRALFFGDLNYEISEVSWTECGDQAELANAFPKLETLHIRGDGTHVMAGLSLEHLTSLTLETGGLNSGTVEGLFGANLPQLHHLELWLGDDSYGGLTDLEELAPLLQGKVFPTVVSLGLRNSCVADEVAIAISTAPILQRLQHLDLSLGTIGNEGFSALATMNDAPNLVSLDVSHHYADTQHIEELQQAMDRRGIEVTIGDAEGEADSEDRYVTLSE